MTHDLPLGFSLDFLLYAAHGNNKLVGAPGVAAGSTRRPPEVPEGKKALSREPVRLRQTDTEIRSEGISLH
jgi:hypothetical protein